MTTKLYRSRTDRKIFGVCGGLAQTLNVDATLLRFVVVVATIFSGGTVGLLYLVAGIVIPEEPVGFIPNDSFGYGYGKSGDGSYSHQKKDSFWDWDWNWDMGCEDRKKDQKTHYGQGSQHAGPHMGSNAHHGGSAAHASAPEQPASDNLDSLMREVEAKALRKEIEELKQRLAKFENEKGDQ